MTKTLKILQAISMLLFWVGTLIYSIYIFVINPHLSAGQLFDAYWPFYVSVLIFGLASDRYVEFRKGKNKDVDFDLKAPSKEVEKELINFGLSLGFTADKFIYRWFSSNRFKENGNATFHIEGIEKPNENNIREKVLGLSFVEKVFKIQVIKLPEYSDNNYQVYIHVKTNLK